jgi:hypothetical protein
MSPNPKARVPKIAKSTSPLTIISTGAATSRYRTARPNPPARCSSCLKSLRTNPVTTRPEPNPKKREQSVRVPVQPEPSGVHRAHRGSCRDEQDGANQRRPPVPHDLDYCHCQGFISRQPLPTTKPISIGLDRPTRYHSHPPCDFLLPPILHPLSVL